MSAYTQYQQIPAYTLRPPPSGAYLDWTAFVASGHAYNVLHTALPAEMYSMQSSTPVLHLPSYVINFAQYPVPITRYPIHVASYPIYNNSYPINATPYNSGVIMSTPLWRATPVNPGDGRFVDVPRPASNRNGSTAETAAGITETIGGVCGPPRPSVDGSLQCDVEIMSERVESISGLQSIEFAREPEPARKRRKSSKNIAADSDESSHTSPAPNTEVMAVENAGVLAKDPPGKWFNGVMRFSVERDSASKVLSWIVENTSRKLSVVATDELFLDGFHNWDAVHAGVQDEERQLQHTFVIARAQRRRALKAIPGLVDIVNTAKAAIVSMELQDTPGEPEWLTAHILNQGDVNARFEWHQDTSEERKETSGRRDRRVLYSAIVKLNRGGYTSMQVCGHPEVNYHSPAGSGILFRSDLHHRTEKAEHGVWKLAMFFGVFL